MSIEKLFSVNGLNAIVTGGASGIGLGFVEGMAENGAVVTILDRDAARIESEVARLCALGHKVFGEVVDITDRPAMRAAFERAAARTGRLDVTFANAGIDPGEGFARPDGGRNPGSEIDAMDDAVWDRTIEINLTGVYNTVKEAARQMKPHKHGSIIVTTSIASKMVGGMVGTPYMPAKAGAAHLVRQLSLDLARYNVRINAIAPGGFITNVGGGHTHKAEVQATFAKLIPLGRMAHPDEMKGLALFLASEASSFITGAEINIDGGMLNGMAQ